MLRVRLFGVFGSHGAQRSRLAPLAATLLGGAVTLVGVPSLAAQESVESPSSAEVAPERVKQPVERVVVPDGDGLPWQVEVRPSVTLSDIRKQMAEEEARLAEEARVAEEAQHAEDANLADRAMSEDGLGVSDATKAGDEIKPSDEARSSGSEQSSLAAPVAFQPRLRDEPQPRPDLTAPRATDPPASQTRDQARPAEATRPAVQPASGAATTSAFGMTIVPAGGDAAGIRRQYRATYDAIPYNRRLEQQRPGYRHELTVLLLTGETLPPVAQPAVPSPVSPGFGGPAVSPYGSYIPAAWDYYQTYPPVFRTLNPYLYGPFGPYGL